MSDSKLQTVVWEMANWRCELWAISTRLHELRLVRNDLLVRTRITELNFYTALAESWQREVFS